MYSIGRILVSSAVSMATFLLCCTPGETVSTVRLFGQTGIVVGLSAGSPAASSLVSAPGITDGALAVAAQDAADGFVDTVNFGTLTNGSGVNSVASIAVRERGNGPCHVSCSVSQFTANSIAYNGTPLTGAGNELTFCGISAGPAAAGNNGDMAGMSYGAQFSSGTGTLASLNAGLIAPVAANKNYFVNFTSRPSRNGGLGSGQNWVQNTAVFSIPTGFRWAPVLPAASGNFVVNVEFAIYPGP